MNNFQDYPSILIAYKKSVAQQIYLMQIQENLKLKNKSFLPRMLRLCKSFGKLIFFKSKNSVLDVEPYLKIKIIISQAAKIICFFSRTCNSIFLISECYFLKLKKPKHIWKPLPTLLKTAVGKGFEIFEKSGVQIFPEKMEQLVKQVRLFF